MDGFRGWTGVVSNITIRRVVMNGTALGVRVKTWQNATGYIKNVRYEDLTMIGVGIAIQLNAYYCQPSYCDGPLRPVETSCCGPQAMAHVAQNVVIQGLVLINITGSASVAAGSFACSSGAFACKDITMNNIDIVAPAGFTCKHAVGRSDNVTPASCLATPQLPQRAFNVAAARPSAGADAYMKTDDTASQALLQRWLRVFEATSLPRVNASTRLPFSFSYGGRSSSELLPTWALKATEERSGNESLLLFEWIDGASKSIRVGVNASLFALDSAAPVATSYVLWFECLGSSASLPLTDVVTLDATWEVSGPATVYSHQGGSGPDWVSHMSYYPNPPQNLTYPGSVPMVIHDQGGMSSLGSLPFAQLEVPSQSIGLSISVGWAGDWSIAFAAPAASRVSIAAMVGSASVNPFLSLRPGERLRYARVLLLQYSASAGSGGRGPALLALHQQGLVQHRRVILDHVSPRRSDGSLFFPKIAAIANKNSVPWAPANVSCLKGMVDAAFVGLEELWIDDVK